MRHLRTSIARSRGFALKSPIAVCLPTIRIYIALWLILMVWMCPGAANATGYISQSAWLADPTGELTYAQVNADTQIFNTYTGVLTKGYTSSTYWVRLRIEPTSAETLVLRIRPTYIDHIELYDPLERLDHQIQPRLSGDRYPHQEDGYQSLNHGFIIKGSEKPRNIYLRLQSTSAMLVYVEAITTTEAARKDLQQELLYSIYLGVLTAFTIWALLQWLASREVLIAVFLVKQAVVLVHALAIQGYLPLLFSHWLSPPMIDRTTSVLALTYVLVGIGFLLLLLHEFKPARWLWWGCLSLLFLYIPITALFIFGEVRLALQANMVIGTLEAIGVLLVAISTRAWDDKQAPFQPPLPRWVLISFNGALLAAALSSAMPSLGAIDGAEWNLNAPIFAGFVNSLLMTVLLSLRAHNLERNRQQALLDLQLAEHETNHERGRRQEQERFLAMLTHELKTPLSVARISLGTSKLIGPQRDRIERALANINAIVDRCRITDQFEHGQLVPQTEPCDLREQLEECVASCSDPSRVNMLAPSAAPVRTDAQLISICLANLLDNALKYSPSGSKITLQLLAQQTMEGMPGNGVSLSIANEIGPAGTPDPAQIFTKYYRSPGAQSKSGSGLGLYLSRSITQLLGGQLQCQINDNHVEFKLWIPA